MQPQKIGKYEIRRTIGRGGMGVVYEGYDPDIDRRVAVKTLLPQLLVDDTAIDFLERFRREARAAARCLHPNIVTVLEYGQHADSPFIVMEYVDGWQLEEVLGREELTLKQALVIAGDVLKALHAAAQSGITHRDVKPANVMVLANGHAKLADFGIARLNINTALTQVGMVVGTPKYMAPEQAAGLAADHRSDLFSLTLILVELLQRARLPTGTPTGYPTPPSALPPGINLDTSMPVPMAFLPLVTDGLQPDPDRRVSSARAYVEQLQSAIRNLADPPARVGLDSEKTVIHPATPQAFGTTDAAIMPLYEADLDTGIVSGIRSDRLQAITEDLGGYLKTDPRPVVKSHTNTALSYAELILGLADEIPKARARRKFTSRWLKD